MQLHKLAEQFLALQDDDDLPAEAIADTLESIEGEIEIKAENIGKLVQNWESDILALETYKKELEAKIKSRKNRIANLKEYLRGNMDATGIKKIDCPLFNITLCDGRPMVHLYDEERLPDEYVDVKVVEKPDRRKILADLKEGVEIEGASLTYSEQTVRIK